MGFFKRRRRRLDYRVLTAYVLTAVILLFFLPWFCSRFFQGDGGINIGSGNQLKIRLLNHQTGEVVTLGLEDYVAGVVAAEMPASFPLDALKAQAVAARTYALKRLQVADPRVRALNTQADISSDPAINQAWISSAEMRSRWGSWNYESNHKKVIRAVEETWGKVAVYNNELIDPAYHASCGGCGTENSEDVWKFAIPYLKRVSCVEHPDKHYDEVKTVSWQQLGQTLDYNVAALAGKKGGVTMQILATTAGGRIKSIKIGDKVLTGAELRSKLNLPSTWMKITAAGGKVNFTTRGYGHGVGLCQYGCAALAAKGKSWSEILEYYYKGIKIAAIN